MKDSDPAGPRDEQVPKKWVDKTWVQLIGVTGAIILFVLVAGLILDWYVNPSPENTKAKRDLVQALALITAGVAGAFGIYFTWRGQRISREGLQLTRANLESTQKDTAEQLHLTQQELHLTQQGQITERFTRAIEQLGATDDKGEMKLEIRLGGIYALERIAWDSPERDYSTVVEVLTAYVRENTPRTPGLSEGSSEAESTPNEAPGEADEGTKQPAAPEPRRPTADTQAILDVLRRAQDRVPEEHRTRLDLHDANLQEAILQETNLVGANLKGADLLGANLRNADLREANLQGANLVGADLQVQGGFTLLQGANLKEADLQGADLRVASLQEAILFAADLREADLLGANLSGADFERANLQEAEVSDERLTHALSLRGATMPDGQKYENWLKSKGSGKH